MDKSKADDIEITPEMIEAGAAELHCFSEEDFYHTDKRDMAKWVFKAMLVERTKSSRGDHKRHQ